MDSRVVHRRMLYLGYFFVESHLALSPAISKFLRIRGLDHLINQGGELALPPIPQGQDRDDRENDGNGGGADDGNGGGADDGNGGGADDGNGGGADDGNDGTGHPDGAGNADGRSAAAVWLSDPQ